MYYSKVLSWVKEFSRVELTRLRDFVRSPYFNKHQKVIELMEIIYDVHPNLSSPKLEKEAVFKKLYPGKKFSYVRLAHVMNYLQAAMEEFIAIEAFEEDNFLKNYFVARQLRKRSSGKLYEQKLMRIKKGLNGNGKYNAQHFYYNSLAENELDYFHLNRKKKTDTNHLQEKSNSLDFFYISTKLEYWCDMLNRSNVLNIDYDYYMLDDVVKLIENNRQKYLAVPWINIYYHILLTLRDSEEQKNYYKLKEYLLQYVDDFEKPDAKTMYDYAQNYCIKRINKGDSKYVKELLDLYKLMLEKELIYENGYIPPGDFKNIVTIACRLKEFDWTEDFLHRYKEKLEERTREHVFQYNLAAFYYEKGDYKNALKLLNTVEFTDSYFALGARSMLMKIYFEINEDEPLFSHFDAFKTYLRRNKIVSKYQNKVHSNFIRYTKRAYQLKTAVDWKRKKELTKEAAGLLEKINKTAEITNRDWLEKQINALNLTPTPSASSVP